MLLTIHNVGVCVWIVIKGYSKLNHYPNLRLFLMGSKNCLETLILFIYSTLFKFSMFVIIYLHAFCWLAQVFHWAKCIQCLLVPWPAVVAIGSLCRIVGLLHMFQLSITVTVSAKDFLVHWATFSSHFLLSTGLLFSCLIS